MFCCGSKSSVEEPQRLTDYELAARLQAQEDRRGRGQRRQPPRDVDWGTGSAGQRLGGAAAPQHDRRQLLAEAAQRRQLAPNGISKARAAELSAEQQKAELIGRLTEQYRRLGEDMPMGLKLGSVEQLKKHLEMLRNRER
mmetsp:Transcript_60758/g.142279  ORF Transcript_60758/g.142279 Transcript_60758/m.142279 type:complete len:140 (+) Transcript_60758:77-496(+)